MSEQYHIGWLTATLQQHSVRLGVLEKAVDANSTKIKVWQRLMRRGLLLLTLTASGVSTIAANDHLSELFVAVLKLATK